MPQDPDSLIPERKLQNFLREVRQADLKAPRERLEGDDLVAWVRSGMNIERAIAEHEAIGMAALHRRRLAIGDWQIDPDGYILPREQLSSSGPTPPTETVEPTPTPDH